MDAPAAIDAKVTARVAIWKDGIPRDIREAPGHPQCAEIWRVEHDGTAVLEYRNPDE